MSAPSYRQPWFGNPGRDLVAGIILPYSLPIAVVSLLESRMTATIVDDFIDTPSGKSRECSGQSVINVTSGGRGRLSTFAAGVFLLILSVGPPEATHDAGLFAPTTASPLPAARCRPTTSPATPRTSSPRRCNGSVSNSW